MLKMRAVILQTILIILLPVIPSPFLASSIIDELPLAEMTMDEQNDLWEQFSFQKVTFSPVGEAISSFDVSEEMGILLLTSENHLLYMGRDGSILAVFQFNCAGLVGVAWDSTDICLFVCRGNIVVRASIDGEFISVSRLSHCDYTTQKVWDELAFRQEKKVEEGTYCIRKAGWFPNLNRREYSELVFIDPSTAEEQIIYDVSNANSAQSLAELCIGIGLLMVIVLIVRGRSRSTGTNQEQGDSTVC